MSQVSCERIEDLISPFLDGEVTLDETEVIVGHLRTCQHCANMYEELQQIKSVLANLPKISPRRNVCKNIFNNTAKQKVVHLKIATRLRDFSSLKKLGMLAASFIVIFFLFVTGVGYFTSSETPSEGFHDEIAHQHAFHCERQPLGDRMVWAFLSGNSLFEQPQMEGD